MPHYDTSGTNGDSRAEHAQKVLADNPFTPAIGIDENAALVVEGDKAMVVSGDGEERLIAIRFRQASRTSSRSCVYKDEKCTHCKPRKNQEEGIRLKDVDKS